MKKNYRILTVIISISLFTVYACKKKAEPTLDPAPVSTGNTSNLDGFFTANALPVQTFTFNSGFSQTLTGSKGTQITFPANAFVTKITGTPVTGNVEISLKEIYTKKDMFLNRAQTTTNTDLLISGGEINITAKQGTTDLKLAAGKQVYVNMTSGTVTPSNQMNVFYGSVNANNKLVWAPSTNTTVIPTAMDSLGGYYYNITSDSLGWINTDQLYNMPGPKTTCTVNLTGNFNHSNTTVWFAFNTLNSAVELFSTQVTQQVYSHYGVIPTGLNITIVAVSEINGQYYSAFVPATITTGLNSTITLTATTNSAILNQLNSL